MNIKHLVAAVALITSAGAVLAQSAPQTESAPQGKTRAEVKAELAQARADGTLPYFNSDVYPLDIPARATVNSKAPRSLATEGKDSQQGS